jgi:hypothetical protein
MGRREMTLDMFGLRAPDSWLATVGLASAGVAVMFLYTPLADRIATRMFDKPPTLELFRAIQQSRVKLIAGIAIAWLLGGFLEELIFQRDRPAIGSLGIRYKRGRGACRRNGRLRRGTGRWCPALVSGRTGGRDHHSTFCSAGNIICAQRIQSVDRYPVPRLL